MILDRCVSRALQHDGRAMAAVVAYTVTLAQFQAEVQLDAHAQGMGIVRNLDSTLSRLAVTGYLTPAVLDGLVDLTRAALGGIQGLSAAVTLRVTELAESYPVATGPKRWDRAVAFLRDNTL